MKILYSYVVPRPFHGYNIPISIQSSYLKDYSRKNNFAFKLPVTEITKTNSYFMLSNLLKDKKIKNLGFVSGFVMPVYQLKRLKNLLKKTSNELMFHFALENLVLNNKQLYDWAKNLNDIKNISCDYSKILNDNQI